MSPYFECYRPSLHHSAGRFIETAGPIVEDRHTEETESKFEIPRLDAFPEEVDLALPQKAAVTAAAASVAAHEADIKPSTSRWTEIAHYVPLEHCTRSHFSLVGRAPAQ